jgi:hypothetical protein
LLAQRKTLQTPIGLVPNERKIFRQPSIITVKNRATKRERRITTRKKMQSFMPGTTFFWRRSAFIRAASGAQRLSAPSPQNVVTRNKPTSCRRAPQKTATLICKRGTRRGLRLCPATNGSLRDRRGTSGSTPCSPNVSQKLKQPFARMSVIPAPRYVP